LFVLSVLVFLVYQLFIDELFDESGDESFIFVVRDSASVVDFGDQESDDCLRDFVVGRVRIEDLLQLVLAHDQVFVAEVLT